VVWVIWNEEVWLRSGLKHFSGFLLNHFQDLHSTREPGFTWNLEEHPTVEEIESLVESPPRACEFESKRPWKRNPEVLRPLVRHLLEGSRVFLVQPGEEPMFVRLVTGIIPGTAETAWN